MNHLEPAGCLNPAGQASFATSCVCVAGGRTAHLQRPENMCGMLTWRWYLELNKTRYCTFWTQTRRPQCELKQPSLVHKLTAGSRRPRARACSEILHHQHITDEARLLVSTPAGLQMPQT